MSATGIESELKFRAADEASLDALAGAATLGSASLGPAQTVDETDTYLDTADLRLAAAGWACRIREREGRTKVSMKGPAEHAAGDLLHRRPELEGPAVAASAVTDWPPSDARDLVARLSESNPLVERLTLAQRRIERTVTVAAVPIGLLSLDRARVLHLGAEVGVLRVVELEFAAAAIASGIETGPLAAALRAQPGLEPDPLNKLERALALVAAAPR